MTNIPINKASTRVPDEGTTQRVLVGDSVHENAEITVREGRLYVEFESEDLDSVTVDLTFLGASRVPSAPEQVERAAEADPMPVFTIQGKDLLALPVITFYRDNVAGLWDGEQSHQVDLAIAEIEAWQKRNPNRCKYPDHAHVPAVLDAVSGPPKSDERG